MCDFIPAVEVILDHEGGFVDNPADPGGATNYGITARVLGDWRGLGRAATPDEVKAMPPEEAVAIYRKRYWQYSAIQDQACATKVFDCAVNMGPHQAHILAQQAANAIGTAIAVDGILGEQSLAAINACDPQEYLNSLCHQQMAFYQNLVDRKPQLAVFRKGWMERAAWPFGQAHFASQEVT